MFRGMGVWAAKAANRAPVIRRERIGEDSNSILGRRGSGQFVKPEAIPRRTSGLLGLQKRSWFHTVETLEAQQFACSDCETKEVLAEPVEKLRGKLESKTTPASRGDAGQRVNELS